MPKSLQHVLSQIDKLRKEADSLRAKEVSGVVARIREAIAHYNLTPEQLFGRAGRKAKGSAASSSAAPKRGRGAPKYRSDDGRTWSGVGKRPAWFVEALANGRAAEDLRVAKSGPQTATTSRKRNKKVKTARAAGVAKYASADGQTWTGVGKRPKWFNEALAAGKTPEDLLVASS